MFPSKSISWIPNWGLDVLLLGRFNPCSLGCFPRSRFGQLHHWQPHSFNPCSLGCFPRRHAAQSIQCQYHPQFQSLFSWMFPSKIVRLCQLGVVVHVVSILVLLDVSLEDHISTRLRRHFTCFNPCSLGCFPRSWQYYNGATYVGNLGQNTCFNPCSLGCFPRRM